jgi:hypothetical protein
MSLSYDVNTKLMLINHVEERDNCFARKFRVLETKCDDGDDEERSWNMQTTPRSISVDPSMVVSRNQNKKLFSASTLKKKLSASLLRGDKIQSMEIC